MTYCNCNSTIDLDDIPASRPQAHISSTDTHTHHTTPHHTTPHHTTPHHTHTTPHTHTHHTTPHHTTPPHHPTPHHTTQSGLASKLVSNTFRCAARGHQYAVAAPSISYTSRSKEKMLEVRDF